MSSKTSRASTKTRPKSLRASSQLVELRLFPQERTVQSAIGYNQNSQLYDVACSLRDLVFGVVLFDAELFAKACSALNTSGPLVLFCYVNRDKGVDDSLLLRSLNHCFKQLVTCGRLPAKGIQHPKANRRAWFAKSDVMCDAVREPDIKEEVVQAEPSHDHGQSKHHDTQLSFADLQSQLRHRTYSPEQLTILADIIGERLERLGSIQLSSLDQSSTQVRVGRKPASTHLAQQIIENERELTSRLVRARMKVAADNCPRSYRAIAEQIGLTPSGLSSILDPKVDTDVRAGVVIAFAKAVGQPTALFFSE